jgi:hypothetical protein
MLLADREYTQELLTTLPCTMLPVGLPILCELAANEAAAEESYRTQLQRLALGALGTLGESVERWTALPPDSGKELASYLAGAKETPGVAAGTGAAVAYLTNLSRSSPDMLGVDRVIAKCAKASDPILRRGAAFCARHWPGTPAQNEVVENALLQLLTDEGTGPGPKENKPGFSIRSQAVLSLAWRGSQKVPLDRLVELLNSKFLETELGEGNEALAVDLTTAALTATSHLASKKVPGLDLSSLREPVEKLAKEAKNPTVQSLAETIRVTLEGKESR